MDVIKSLINPERARVTDAALLENISRHKQDSERGAKSVPSNHGARSVDPSFAHSEEETRDSSDEAVESEASVVVRNVRNARNVRNGRRATVANTEFASKESLIAEKADLLYKLDRLERSGENVSKRYTLADDFVDIQTEVTRLERDRSLLKSIKFQQSMLTSFTTGLEYVNNRFDPFGIQLEGWSESVHDGIGQYDDVFAELHDKYQTKSSLPPEVKLLLMLGGSAFMFHMTNSMFKTMPGMEHVMKQNPGLARDVAAATARTMARDLPATGDPLGGGLGSLAKMCGGLMSDGAASASATRHDAAEIEEIFSEISDNDSVVKEAVEQRNTMAGMVVLDDV